MSYQPKIYRKQGGSEMVIASGGTINVEPGGKIVADGTQAANIAAIAVTGTTFTTGMKVKFNSILTALENVGILATS